LIQVKIAGFAGYIVHKENRILKYFSAGLIATIKLLLRCTLQRFVYYSANKKDAIGTKDKVIATQRRCYEKLKLVQKKK
jgi:hypothetical protein